jgi:hypothetical protein
VFALFALHALSKSANMTPQLVGLQIVNDSGYENPKIIS